MQNGEAYSWKNQSNWQSPCCQQPANPKVQCNDGGSSICMGCGQPFHYCLSTDTFEHSSPLTCCSHLRPSEPSREACTCDQEREMERQCEKCGKTFTEEMPYPFRVAKCKVHHDIAGAVCCTNADYLFPKCENCKGKIDG